MQRLKELDSLRGLAALGVVLHHGLFYTGALSASFADHLRSTPLQVFVQGRPFVLLFFVLSGFVLSRALAATEPAVRLYLVWSLQRAVRLVLPALASVVMSAGLYWAAFDGNWPGETAWMQHQSWAEPPDLRGMAMEGMLGDVGTLNNPLWTLVIELRISFLIPLLVWFARPGDKCLALLFGGLGLFAFAGGSRPWLLSAGGDLGENVQSLLYFLFPFVLGVCLERSALCKSRVGGWAIWMAAFAIAGLARASFDLAVILGAGLSIWLVQQPGQIRNAMRVPVLTWLGRISFSLYLVHVPLLIAAFHWLHADRPALAIVALAVVAALPAAWAFHLVIERPAHRLARSIGGWRGLRSASLVRQ